MYRLNDRVDIPSNFAAVFWLIFPDLRCGKTSETASRNCSEEYNRGLPPRLFSGLTEENDSVQIDNVVFWDGSGESPSDNYLYFESNGNNLWNIKYNINNLLLFVIVHQQIDFRVFINPQNNQFIRFHYYVIHDK